jgi:hypothetical protein
MGQGIALKFSDSAKSVQTQYVTPEVMKKLAEAGLLEQEHRRSTSTEGLCDIRHSHEECAK